MFTGLIQKIGTVERIGRNRISILSGFDDLAGGESIAVDGVCLTVDDFKDTLFEADISEETLKKTMLGGLKKGSVVHLERALTFSGSLGGHFVQGHVDGIGEITGISRLAGSTMYKIRIPENLISYIAPKGSIALDGISLTIAEVLGRTISVAMIPHTERKTHWRLKRVGSKVNVETDILAKYVARQFLKTNMGELFQKKEINMSTLMEGGFE